MDIRYSCNQKDFKRYTTEEMRDEMLITGLYKADEVVAVYSHVDRMVTLGCMPVHETVSIDKGIDIWANFGTHYFLERREIGMFNIGKDSTGIVVADGVKYELGYKDCLYITQGTKEVTFASADPEHPAPRAIQRRCRSPSAAHGCGWASCSSWNRGPARSCTCSAGRSSARPGR